MKRKNTCKTCLLWENDKNHDLYGYCCSWGHPKKQDPEHYCCDYIKK
uniref:Uncharacterized protein n=1 Tax=viral metagenome TaxID=1070528 RepID=A0A6H1ZYB1_9ZZZZ